MKFCLVLCVSMMSLTAARGQYSVSPGPKLNQLSELTPEQRENCIRRSLECDNDHGCRLNTPLDELQMTPSETTRANQCQSQLRLQLDLQRRAVEAQKKHDVQRRLE